MFKDHSINTQNYAATSYRTLKQVFETMGWKTQKNDKKNFKKLIKAF